MTPTLALGGSERLTVRYAAGLKARGHDVAIAYSVKNLQLAMVEEAEIPVFKVASWLPQRSTAHEWVRDLRRVVREFQPDVVHAQSVATAALARFVAPRTPLLVMIHGVSRRDEPLASLALRLLRTKVTAVSDPTAVGLSRFPWSPTVEVLHTGVDTGSLRADAARLGPVELVGSPRLCCVARHMPEKGIDVLLHATARLVERLPDVGLTLVGDGLDLKAHVSLAEELGLAGRVLVTGGVPNAAPYLAAADVVVLPSRREGLPVVALEALALGRPLVATAVGGTPSVCIEGETGWLVRPEDPAALADRIQECVESPEEAARRAGAGRELIEREFSTEHMLDRLETLLVSSSGRLFRVPPTKPRAYYRGVRVYRRASTLASRGRPLPDWSGLRIFGYHRVSPDDDVYAVSPPTFAAHMRVLRDSGVEVVRLSDALELLHEPVAGRYACITFDDGYLDNLVHAGPVLKELGLPATIFAITEILEGRLGFDWYRSNRPAAITADHVPELLEQGVFDLQCHSATHPRLTVLTTRDLEREIAQAKVRLERLLPYEVTSFSYPAGLYGPREVAAVLAAGFRAGVTTRAGVNAGGVGTGELRRTMIGWRDSAADFAAKLGGRDDEASWLVERLQARRARGARRADVSTAS
ncbi:MAG TPA: glycosyltransferase [Gaiellaceae bacterium]|nr:glycosyltransferase [Gaiellaceae bacterium]